MKPWSRLLLTTVLTVAFSGVVYAQYGSDPTIGTWTLNLAKSSYKPGPAPQSETRMYESAPEGMTHLTVHQVGADGNSVMEETTYKRDGKPYAFTGSPNIDAVEVTTVNDLERRSTLVLHGKVVGHISYKISKDGKTMTANATFRNASGKMEHDLRVYDRQ